MKKLNIDLTGVPQTLLLPLLGRAVFSENKNSPIQDHQALKLVQSLNFDFQQLLQRIGPFTPMWWIARAYQFDRAVKKFLTTNPTAVIVNLGAGLDTAFERVDNGRLTWVDLDLPEVIDLRQKLLPPPPRVHYLAKSLLDESWFEAVKEWGNKFFFFCGGVLTYFAPADVKKLLTQMAEHFPDSELIFDSVNHKTIHQANLMLRQSQIQGAQLKWAIDDPKELERWSDHIKVIDHRPYFKGLKIKYFSPSIRWKMWLYDLTDRDGIIQIKFGPNP